MKNLKNHALKAIVLLTICCPAVFADGDMGGGGLAKTEIGTTKDDTVIIRTVEEGGDMGGGGLAASTSLSEVMKAVFDYLKSTI